MAYAWQSVEEAAVTLGISTRTLHRRISKGEVETRLEDGRREVLVCLPDPEPELPPEAVDVSDGVSAQPAPSVSGDHSTAIILAEKEIQLANEKVRRTELALAAFQHTSTLLQKEATRTRMSARCAWAAVAVLSVGVYVAVGWTASKVTEFRANNANLTQQLRQASDVAEQKTADAERYRDERDKAREAAARSDGELSATKASLVRKPATQPTLLEKIGLVRSAD
ncbi:MAG TPA: hypothetical protein VH475_11085 [Tepidisphaeraceae bacterium]|jgi:hypothetical protein